MFSWLAISIAIGVAVDFTVKHKALLRRIESLEQKLQALEEARTLD